MFKNFPPSTRPSSVQLKHWGGSSELMQVCLTVLAQLGQCQLLPLPSQLSGPGPPKLYHLLPSNPQDTTLI